MQTLGLNVENRIGIDDDVVVRLDIIGKSFLVFAFDFLQSFKDCRVRLVVFKLFKVGRVFYPACADSVAQKRRKPGVRLLHPATMRDTVRNVGEFRRVLFVIILENVVFQYFAVQRRNAVYRMRRDKTQRRHFNLTVFQNRVCGNLIVVAGIFRPEFFAIAAVDFAHDLVNARKQ